VCSKTSGISTTSATNDKGEGELQLVTECWVEPQNGVLDPDSRLTHHFGSAAHTPLSHVPYLRGLAYHHLPDEVST